MGNPLGKTRFCWLRVLGVKGEGMVDFVPVGGDTKRKACSTLVKEEDILKFDITFDLKTKIAQFII